jgi:hypothetical protein
MTEPADVTLGRLMLNMTSALSETSLKWCAVLMSFGITIGVLVRPEPWRVSAGAVFVALVSPLWLRRERSQ